MHQTGEVGIKKRKKVGKEGWKGEIIERKRKTIERKEKKQKHYAKKEEKKKDMPIYLFQLIYRSV